MNSKNNKESHQEILAYLKNMSPEQMAEMDRKIGDKMVRNTRSITSSLVRDII